MKKINGICKDYKFIFYVIDSVLYDIIFVYMVDVVDMVDGDRILFIILVM